MFRSATPGSCIHDAAGGVCRGCITDDRSVDARGAVVLLTQASQALPTKACMAALIAGTLIRDAQSASAFGTIKAPCIRSPGKRLLRARRCGRLALVDENGRVLAHEGDHVSLGGGEIAALGWLVSGRWSSGLEADPSRQSVWCERGPVKTRRDPGGSSRPTPSSSGSARHYRDARGGCADR